MKNESCSCVRINRAIPFCVTILCVILLCFGGIRLSPVCADTQSTAKPKLIHVVFDDSGSMADHNSTAWCQAKYALEVLAAMMGEEDVLRIYEMSAYRPKGSHTSCFSITGSDAERVKKIHDDWQVQYGQFTPYQAIAGAGDELVDARGDYEKWLVILTDGDTMHDYDAGNRTDDGSYVTIQKSQNGDSRVQNDINRYNDQGIKTAYLAITTKNDPITLKNYGTNGFAYEAEKNGEILARVTEIANQIFEHLVMPANRINQVGNEYDVSVDIPVRQFIVFAQGDNISAKKMKLNGQSMPPSEIIDVRFDDKFPYRVDDQGGIRSAIEEEKAIDESLNGKLLIFSAPDGQPFNAGTYRFEVSAKDDPRVEVYYALGVSTSCTMDRDGKAVASTDNILYTGNYQFDGHFVDPVTGEVVTSDLLKGATIRLTILNNGVPVLENQTSGRGIEIERGSLSITAEADLPGNVHITETHTYNVYPYSNAELDLGTTKWSISQDALKGNQTAHTCSFSANAVDYLTKKKLDTELWKNIYVEVAAANGVAWTCEAGKDGSFVFTPYAVGKASSVPAKELQFSYTIRSSLDQKVIRTGTLTLNVSAFDPFKVDSAIEKTFTQEELVENGKDIMVSLTKSGNGTLSDEVWGHIKCGSIQSKQGIKWIVSKEQKGSVKLNLQSADGKLRSVINGTHEFELSFTYDDGDFVIQKTTKLKINITKNALGKVCLLPKDNKNFAFSVKELENGKQLSFTGILVSKDTMRPLDAELWSLADVSINNSNGLTWEVVKGKNAPEVIISVKASQKANDIMTGAEISVGYQTSSENDSQTIYKGNIKIDIEDYLPFVIKSVGTYTAKQDEVRDNTNTEVVIEITAPDGNALEETVWKYCKIQAIPDQHGIHWDVRKGDKGFFYAKPCSADGNVFSVEVLDYNVPVTIEFNDEDLVRLQNGAISVSILAEKSAGGGFDGNGGVSDEEGIPQEYFRGGKEHVANVYLTDVETGAKTDEEHWKATDISIEKKYGIQWGWERDKVAPWEILKATASNGFGAIDTGELTFTYTTLNTMTNSPHQGLYTIKIIPFVPLRFNDRNEVVKQEELKDGARTITIKLTDKNGQPLDQRTWNSVQSLTIDDKDEIVWNVVKGKVGEFELTPRSADGKLRSVLPGVHTFSMTVLYEEKEENFTYSETKVLSIEVSEQPPKYLEIDIGTADEWKRSRFSQEGYAPITVTVKEDQKAISKELYDYLCQTEGAISAVAEDGKKVDLSLIPTGLSGEWYLVPSPHNGKGYNTDYGIISITVKLNAELNEILYSGLKSMKLTSESDLWNVIWEWILDNLWWIIPTLILLYLYLGYYGKKRRLNTKNYKLVVAMDNNQRIAPLELSIKKQLSTVIIPWPFCGAQKADVNCYTPEFFCSFPNFTIIATGKKRRTNGFRIVNDGRINSINFDQFTINGRNYTSVDELTSEKTKFNLGSFTILCSMGRRKDGLIRLTRRV